MNVKNKIYEIRGRQVMLDSDLAEIYQVQTMRLNEAVKRNLDRFPPEFMFQLTQEEYANLISQIAISSLKCQNGISNLKFQIGTSSWGGRRKLPYVFTEHGVVMLSSVLNSKVATEINIAVIRAFVAARRYIASNSMHEKLENLERVLMLHIDDTGHNFAEHVQAINEIIDRLNNLIETPPKPRRPIGFRTNDD